MKSARYESVPSVHFALTKFFFAFFLSFLYFLVLPCFFAFFAFLRIFLSLKALLILVSSVLVTTTPGGTPPPAETDTGTCRTWPYGLPSGEPRSSPTSTIGTLAVNMCTRSVGVPFFFVPLNRSASPGVVIPSAVAEPVPTRDFLHAAVAASGVRPSI